MAEHSLRGAVCGSTSESPSCARDGSPACNCDSMALRMAGPVLARLFAARGAFHGGAKPANGGRMPAPQPDLCKQLGSRGGWGVANCSITAVLAVSPVLARLLCSAGAFCLL